MPTLTRLRSYAGPWTVVGLLGMALVFVAAAAGPVNRHILDQALRHLVEAAPDPTRDITFTERIVPAEPVVGERPAGSAERIRSVARGLLPSALDQVVGSDRGIQRTRTEEPLVSAGLSMSITGPGVVTGPLGLYPLVTLQHQTGLAPDIELVDGSEPETDRTDDPAGVVVEVMVSAGVAEEFGLRVGESYPVLLGVAPLAPGQVGEGTARVVVRVTGVFEPVDPSAPVWQSDPRLLTPGLRVWPLADGFVPLPIAILVTDQPGIDTLLDLGRSVEIENVARVRIDDTRLDHAWVRAGRDAVSELLASPDRRAGLTIRTGLLELIGEFERQAAASQAVTSVVAAGLIGTGVGLLLLAARVTVDRRRGELSLLRARGASVSTMVRRFAGEAVLVLVPAAALGWTLHRLVPGRPDPALVLGVGAAPLVAAVVAVLVVPAAVAASTRPGGSSRAGAGRSELARHRGGPVRVTAELLAVVLAGLGVVVLHQRGLSGASAVGAAGTADPYLSAVPVLIGVAAGLLALRLYPWPLRVAGALAGRWRGAVAFLGLARTGRAAPATALPLLVLVLAVAVGGFAGAVSASVSAARDTAAVRAVGADARIEAEGITDQVVAAVAGVSGVEAVATTSDQGFVRMGGGADINITVVTVDAPAYQRILSGIGAAARLPEPVVSAGPGTDPLPVLTWATVDPDRPLSVELEGVEHPAVAVGEVTGLPQLAGGSAWVLVPGQALASPPPADQLLIGGPEADLDALRAAVAVATGGTTEQVSVTTLADRRAELSRSGFGLTTVLAIGTVGAALGGLIAVGLALVVQAAARGRALSLLRTMGLSAGQARGLLLVELVPVTALAVAVGAATGAAMPLLLGPALGLRGFAGGAAVPFGLDVRTVLVLGGLFGIFVIGGALVEGAVNRRLGLGQVLRVD